MRLPLLLLLPALASWHASPVDALDQGGLYPPGLLPLINRGNVLLSSGQFSEAAKVLSEAIDQAPSDYLLYYKRATAYFSLQRHANALDDFEKVLSLTSNTFDNAHLMKARIYAKEGLYDLARPSLKLYMKAKDKSREKDPDIDELEKEINEGEELRTKVEKERKAELWTACAETASVLLRKASHSIEVRSWRAECAFASGDLESAVGDLSRLSQILPPSTSLLTHVARLSYFLLAPSAGTMNTLKQCLHYDPDSKPCLTLHRLVKSLDKSISKVEELLTAEDWRGVVKLLLTASGGKKNGDVWQKWEDAMEEHVGKKENVLPLVPSSLLQSALPEEKRRAKHLVLEKLPIPDAKKVSPIRQTFVRALCRSFTHLADSSQGAEYKKQMGTWCDQLLTLQGCEEDIDGLVGHAESLITKEAYTEAVQVLTKAFEQSGSSNRSIHTRLTKAQKLLKQSKQKDYYKILGVGKDADEKTIRKAFRQAAKVAHPDKGGSEEKMAAVNEAYEVLTDPEKRARVDAGEDPNDPNAGMGYGPGGFPFASYGAGGFGGHPFGQFSQFFAGGSGGAGQGHGPGGFQFHYSHGGRRGH